MAKNIIVTGKPARRIEVTGKPQRRIEPAELAAALGAEPVGEYLGANLDPITLAELGTQLLSRLRSTGGRPALADATEICRVPLSAEDVQALEKITEQVERATGAKPSPGQVASVIVRSYLNIAGGKAQEPGGAVAATENARAEAEKDPHVSLAAVKELISQELKSMQAELDELAK